MEDGGRNRWLISAFCPLTSAFCPLTSLLPSDSWPQDAFRRLVGPLTKAGAEQPVALQTLDHLVAMNHQVRDFGEDEAVSLDLRVQIAGQVGEVIKAGQNIARNGVEIGL